LLFCSSWQDPLTGQKLEWVVNIHGEYVFTVAPRWEPSHPVFFLLFFLVVLLWQDPVTGLKVEWVVNINGHYVRRVRRYEEGEQQRIEEQRNRKCFDPRCSFHHPVIRHNLEADAYCLRRVHRQPCICSDCN
jgi:hypothetical protein